MKVVHEVLFLIIVSYKSDSWCQLDYSYRKKQKHWWQKKPLQMIKTEDGKLTGWSQKQYGWLELKK
jgi:hypothetical protein